MTSDTARLLAILTTELAEMSGHDPEGEHARADEILLEALIALGANDLAQEWRAAAERIRLIMLRRAP